MDVVGLSTRQGLASEIYSPMESKIIIDTEVAGKTNGGYNSFADAFGTADYKELLYNVMKDFLDIKEKANT